MKFSNPLEIPLNKPILPLVIILSLLLSAIIISQYWTFIKIGPDKNKEVTLKFWGLWETEIVEPIIKDFQDLHPRIKVIYEKREAERYFKIIQSRIDSGLGPDIFYYRSKWLPMLKRQLLTVPKNILDPKDLEKTFWPVAKSDLTLGDKVYGLPVNYEGLALLYNKEILRGAGIEQPPDSWDELRIRQLPSLVVKNKEGEIQTGGIALGTAENVDYSPEILQLMMAQNGVDFIKGNLLLIHQSRSSDAQKRNLGADALSFYVSFAKETNSVWSEKMPSSVEAFINARVALTFAPNSKINEILTKSQHFRTPLDLRVAKVPQLLDRPPLTWGTVNAVGVSSNTLAKNEAWEFLKFFTSIENTKKILQNQKLHQSVPDIPARKEVAESLKEDPYLSPFIEQANNAVNFYGGNLSMDEELNDAISPVFKEMVTGALKGDSVNTLNTATFKIEEILVKYNILVREPTPT